MYNLETLKKLLTNGNSLKIDAKSTSINDLTELVALAASHGATLHITNASQVLKGSLESLSSIGGTALKLDF